MKTRLLELCHQCHKSYDTHNQELDSVSKIYDYISPIGISSSSDW